MKKLSTWLILLGLVLLALPLLGRFYTHWQQDQQYQAYLAGQAARTTEADIMAPTFSEEDVAPAENTPAVEPEPEGVIGRIKIPAIDCDLLLLEGSSAAELRYGAGHVSTTAQPGEVGNCAIAGHRNYAFAVYFNHLDQVEPEDQVFVERDGKTFCYEVYKSFTVLPSEVWVLDPIEGESTLTLITCTPKGSTSHRLIVQAKLIP